MIKYTSLYDRVFTCLHNSLLFSNPLEVANYANFTVYGHRGWESLHLAVGVINYCKLPAVTCQFMQGSILLNLLQYL